MACGCSIASWQTISRIEEDWGKFVQVDFYHLAVNAPARVIARIAERILAGGGRLLVVAGDAARAEALDEALWATTPDSFLPHGLAGAAGAADQPVLIAPTLEDDVAPANGARHVALTDGVWRDAALGFERAFHFFDDGTIAAARIAWKGLAAHEAVTRNYWKQSDAGGWEKVA